MSVTVFTSTCPGSKLYTLNAQQQVVVIQLAEVSVVGNKQARAKMIR